MGERARGTIKNSHIALLFNNLWWSTKAEPADSDRQTNP